MFMAYKKTKSEESQPTTPYLDHLRNIFSTEFITANQSKFCTKDGKIDFKKLEQVLVKEGYSEGFVRRLVNDLKNGEVNSKNVWTYQKIAKNDIDLNRERLEEIYGKHGAKVARAVLDFFENNGDIKSKRFIRLSSMAGTLKSWKEFSDPVQMVLSSYALGEISEREFRGQIGEVIKIIPKRQFETLEFVLSKGKVLEKDLEETGGRNYEAIAAAKNMQELEEVAKRSGLFNEVTWNNLVNEIANMIMKHAEILPYEQQQQQFITQIVLYYYQQAIYEEIEEKKKESEKRNRPDRELEEERKMREFAKNYVDTLKADGKAADIETLIINNLKENEKRLNNIAENFMGMMDSNGKMKEEEMRVLETLAGKRPPVDFATLSPETKAKLLKAIRTGLVGYA
jgi:hypothetical protein